MGKWKPRRNRITHQKRKYSMRKICEGTKRIHLWLLAGMMVFIITGCQATPEESAVVNKSKGLDDRMIAEPVKEGETTVIDIPEHWKVSEKRSADRVTISADMHMNEIEVGNLPVMEMKNHAMSQEELEKLVRYFTGDQILYQPYIDTRQDYESVIACIKNQEGAYADPILYSGYQSDIKYLENALDLAPEEEVFIRTDAIEFQKKAEDPAWQEVNYASLTDQQREEQQEKREQEIYFDADAGEDRASHIQAVNYQNTLANSSSFVWWAGDIAIDEDTVSLWMEDARTRVDAYGSEYDLQYMERLISYEDLLEEEPFSSEEGREQAENVLEDLGIQGVEQGLAQKAIWFPAKTFSTSHAESLYQQIWQADLTQAEAGYEYIYTRGAGGISAGQMRGSVMGDSASGESVYAPPFPVEKISIAVTESGVKSFSWEGMCEEVGIIAENTKLLSFENIQEKVFDYVYYNYTMLGQPESSQSKFTYTIYDMALGYTYVPAFQNPENAWLVPAWFVKAEEYIDAAPEGGKAYSRGTREIMVNALDGGLIAYPAS